MYLSLTYIGPWKFVFWSHFNNVVHILSVSYTKCAWSGSDFIMQLQKNSHYELMKWKHFPRYWPFVRGIHRWPVNSPHKCQWRRALMFSLIYAWINGWVNNREAGDLRRNRAHYDVVVMFSNSFLFSTDNLPRGSRWNYWFKNALQTCARWLIRKMVNRLTRFLNWHCLCTT